MAEFELQGTGGNPVDPPPVPTSAVTQPGHAGVLQGYVLELNHYYARIRLFRGMEPDDVLRELSGISGRLCEMRATCWRIADSGDRSARTADKLRIKEIDPMLAECDRQYKVHSRIQATREFELKMMGGAT